MIGFQSGQKIAANTLRICLKGSIIEKIKLTLVR
jgi:hypothetical protein